MKCYASGPDNQKESVVPCCLWSQHAVASCFEVFQLLQQFPDAFEFSSSILLRLAEEVRFSKNQLGKMRKKWQRYQNTLNLICTTIQMQFTVYMCIVYQKKKIQFQFQVCFFAWSPTKKKAKSRLFPTLRTFRLLGNQGLYQSLRHLLLWQWAPWQQDSSSPHMVDSLALLAEAREKSCRVAYFILVVCFAAARGVTIKRRCYKLIGTQKQSHAMSHEYKNISPFFGTRNLKVGAIRAIRRIRPFLLVTFRWAVGTREGSESSTFPQLVPSELRDLGGVFGRHDLTFANHDGISQGKETA